MKKIITIISVIISLISCNTNPNSKSKSISNYYDENKIESNVTEIVKYFEQFGFDFCIDTLTSYPKQQVFYSL